MEIFNFTIVLKMNGNDGNTAVMGIMGIMGMKWSFTVQDVEPGGKVDSAAFLAPSQTAHPPHK